MDNSKTFSVVHNGIIENFNELKDFLIATHDHILVEASPVDSIWGVGMAQDHVDIQNPEKWKGLNLLGFALMQVRAQLLAQSN